MISSPSFAPFLWFDDQAEEAAKFYVSVFPNSEILHTSYYSEAGPGPAGSVMVVKFSLNGFEVVALNGGPDHYGFDESISIAVTCATQEEVDTYWDALCAGGEEIACGWLKDRYGLRWQIIPGGFVELVGDPDPEKATRAAKAMFGMKKLDIAALREAVRKGD